jgi:hypothetical protein
MTGDSLDESRLLSVIAQCRADLVDGEVNTSLKINKGVRIPDVVADLVSRHDLTGMFREHEKDSELLRLKSYDIAMLVQCAIGSIQFVRAKTNCARVGPHGGHADTAHILVDVWYARFVDDK